MPGASPQVPRAPAITTEIHGGVRGHKIVLQHNLSTPVQNTEYSQGDETLTDAPHELNLDSFMCQLLAVANTDHYLFHPQNHG